MLLFVTFVSTSCILSIDGIMGKGPIIDEYVAVTGFSSVETSSSADVEITKGDSLEVILSDYENFLEYWDIKVVNNTLIIQTKPFTSLVNSKAKVKVVLPTALYEVKVSGSGDIKLNSAFPELEKASISGSGNINGNVSAEYSKLFMSISGSGSFNFIGTAEELKASTTGSGKMYLSDLVANDAICSVLGSGNMYVYAKKSLKVVITGSGNIVYSGNPVVDVQASGSGRLKHD